MELKQILHELMKKHDLNPYQLANETGISYSVIHAMVNGKTKKASRKNTARLAVYFRVTEDYIRTGKMDAMADVGINEKELGGRIKALLAMKGITRYVLGKDTDIAQASLAWISDGTYQKLSNENTTKIAAYFGVSEYWLRTGKGKTPNDNNLNLDLLNFYESQYIKYKELYEGEQERNRGLRVEIDLLELKIKQFRDMRGENKRQ